MSLEKISALLLKCLLQKYECKATKKSLASLQSMKIINGTWLNGVQCFSISFYVSFHRLCFDFPSAMRISYRRLRPKLRSHLRTAVLDLPGADRRNGTTVWYRKGGNKVLIKFLEGQVGQFELQPFLGAGKTCKKHSCPCT